MEVRITTTDAPPRSPSVEFKRPYTHYGPPNFDTPEYIYEVTWVEKVFAGKRLVIRKYIFNTPEEAEKEFQRHKQKWYGKPKPYGDTEVNVANEKLAKELKEYRIRQKKIMDSIEDYYPIKLREYMERLRRAKWVRNKRRSEKRKVMGMDIITATEYLEAQTLNFEKEENDRLD